MIEFAILAYIASLMAAFSIGRRSGIRDHQAIVYENGWKSIWRRQEAEKRQFDRMLAIAKDIRDICEDSAMSGDEYEKVLTALEVIESGGYHPSDRQQVS